MPEGDTILRTARTLEKAIGGQVIARVFSGMPTIALGPIVGQRIEAVAAQGKNLLIHFENGQILRTHMRMTGSWHIYRPGERWQRPERLARLWIEAGGWVAVCFSAPVIELLTARQAAVHGPLIGLGPDILAEVFDCVEAVRRLKAGPERPIGDAMLDQSNVSGIGNIYKSESLFLAGLDPRTPVGLLAETDRVGLLETARALMRANLVAPQPTLNPSWPVGARRWVYGRSGAPCLRCGTRITIVRQGHAQRSTYYCPKCQTKA